MPYKRSLLKKYPGLFLWSAAMLLCIWRQDVYAQYWDFPPPPKPYDFGNLLINRASEKNNMQPVTFSHWSHREKYTCRVCHFELYFEMAVNTTEITEEDNRNGLFCGACHNDVAAFGHTEKNCAKCHNGNLSYGKEKFQALRDRLPADKFGNNIDWVGAIAKGKITPKYSIFAEDEKPMEFDKRLTLEAEWNYVPPAYFPHAEHVQWLDCSNCHPDIFQIKKKTTKHFLMEYILERKFCGVCHLNVAFPMNDCTRCHPRIKGDVK
jgi:c(7)-type cytochrome triheme protein